MFALRDDKGPRSLDAPGFIYIACCHDAHPMDLLGTNPTILYPIPNALYSRLFTNLIRLIKSQFPVPFIPVSRLFSVLEIKKDPEAFQLQGLFLLFCSG